MAFQFAAACASSGLRINYLCDYPSKQNEELFPYDSNSNKGLEEINRKAIRNWSKSSIQKSSRPKRFLFRVPI